MSRAKVIINVPVLVECEVQSMTNSEEALFNLDKTDAVMLTDFVMPSKISCAMSNIVILENYPATPVASA